MVAKIHNARITSFVQHSSELLGLLTRPSVPPEQVLPVLWDLIEENAEILTVEKFDLLSLMIRIGRYDAIDSDINEKNFTMKPKLLSAEGLRVIDYGKEMKTQAVLADFYERGLEAGSIEQLLAYGVKNPEEQRLYPIVGLGSSCMFPGTISWFPYLAGSAYSRSLNLGWVDPESPWSGGFRFLAFGK